MKTTPDSREWEGGFSDEARTPTELRYADVDPQRPNFDGGFGDGSRVREKNVDGPIAQAE